MSVPTIRDSTPTNPGGTGSTIISLLPTHAAGDIVFIAIGNTGNTAWTGNPAGWSRRTQNIVGTSSNGIVGSVFYRRILPGDTLPLTNPTFTLGATVTRIALAWAIDSAYEDGVFTFPAWSGNGFGTGTNNPVRPPSVTTQTPDSLILHLYFQRAATNAPDPATYTQNEEIIISGTLVGNGSSKTVANRATVLSNQDASPTSGARWMAGIISIPIPPAEPFLRRGSFGQDARLRR